MIFYYLDASAWVKRYYQEKGTGWVQDFFSRSQALACSSLGFVEVTATLARKRKAGEIDSPQLDNKLQELETDWDNFVQIQFTTEVVNSAATLTRQLALRGADAVHLASALFLQERFGGDDDQLIFIASDEELKKAARASGLTVVDPNEQEEPVQPQPE